MSYLVQAKLAGDSTLFQRVTACAAIEGITDPAFWAQNHAWQFSAEPGWVDKYKAAQDAGGDPGADEDAITDAMIRTAVQRLVAEGGQA